jgi:hypothetical protein
MFDDNQLIFIEPTKYYITEKEPMALDLDTCCGIVFLSSKTGVAHACVSSNEIGISEGEKDITDFIITPRQAIMTLLDRMTSSGIQKKSINAGIFGCKYSQTGVENYMEAYRILTGLKISIFHLPPYGELVNDYNDMKIIESRLPEFSGYSMRLIISEGIIKGFYTDNLKLNMNNPDETIKIEEIKNKLSPSINYLDYMPPEL